eukprot:6270753-Pyramimonas_sp.AAC.1
MQGMQGMQGMHIDSRVRCRNRRRPRLFRIDTETGTLSPPRYSALGPSRRCSRPDGAGPDGTRPRGVGYSCPWGSGTCCAVWGSHAPSAGRAWAAAAAGAAFPTARAGCDAGCGGGA